MPNNPLQSTGEISFANINLELARASNAELSLDAAENTGINQCASPKPSASNPAAMNEWYGYNHAYSPTLIISNYDVSSTDCTTACALPAAGSGNVYTSATGTYYTNIGCTTTANGYYVNEGRTTCYYITSGSLQSTTACTTTTTTTTTTLATGNCYEVYAGGAATTVYWQSTDGTNRSSSISSSDGTKYICSLITPYESPTADLVVNGPGSSCTNNCQVITCKSCAYP